MNIQKSVELASDLFECAHMNKACALIEMNTLLAPLGHAGDERMIPQPSCLLDNRILELAPMPRLRCVE